MGNITVFFYIGTTTVIFNFSSFNLVLEFGGKRHAPCPAFLFVRSIHFSLLSDGRFVSCLD